jgi:MFS transporter, DHA1 family, inner membrane transport protein
MLNYGIFNSMTSVEQSYLHRLYPRLAILAVGLFIVGTNGFVIAGLLPSIAHSLHVPASSVSYSITYYAIVVAVASPAVSIFLPTVSRTRLMASGLVLVLIGTVVAAAAPTLLVFTAGRIIAALGGAALVPAATATAAILAAPEKRGRAIAFVAVGFTAAIAFGAPLGTLLAGVGGWRVPLFGLAALAGVTAVAIASFVRHIPLGEPVSARRRFAILRDPRILLALITTLCAVTGFNVVYIFSSAVTAAATGGSATLLALLLLIFGVAGIAGNSAAGPLTDRFGNRWVAIVVFVVLTASLVTIAIVSNSFVAIALVFVFWGISANAVALPVQHRLVQIDPATAAVALSWYSTALYAGIALAPPLGAFALSFGNPHLVPLFGAGAVVLGGAAFLLGHVARRSVSMGPAAGVAD